MRILKTGTRLTVAEALADAIAASWDAVAPLPMVNGSLVSPSSDQLEILATVLLQARGIDPAQNTPAVLGGISVRVDSAVCREEPHLKRLRLPALLRAEGIDQALEPLGILHIRFANDADGFTVQFYRHLVGGLAAVFDHKDHRLAGSHFGLHFIAHKAEQIGRASTDAPDLAWLIAWKVNRIEAPFGRGQVRPARSAIDFVELGLRRFSLFLRSAFRWLINEPRHQAASHRGEDPDENLHADQAEHGSVDSQSGKS